MKTKQNGFPVKNREITSLLRDLCGRPVVQAWYNFRRRPRANAL